MKKTKNKFNGKNFATQNSGKLNPEHALYLTT